MGRRSQQSRETTCLSDLFRASLLEQFEAGTHHATIDRSIRTFDIAPPARREVLVDFLGRVYQYMFQRCRSEYVYKNEIIRRIFLPRFDPVRATVLSELPLMRGQGFADLAFASRTTTAVEVKTEYDSTLRMERQLDLALRLFDRVLLVCPEQWACSISEVADERVGIVAMRASGSFKLLRAARPNAENVDPWSIRHSIPQADQAEAIRRYLGIKAPSSGSAWDMAAYLELFERLRPVDAHRVWRGVLVRQVDCAQAQRLKDIPPALTHLSYQVKRPLRDRFLALSLLTRPVFQ
jgi:hypothetical protein